MKNNKKTSPFAGIKIGWLELDALCCPEVASAGKKLDPVWNKNTENRFSAELDFGVLNLEIIQLANGIRICSSLDLTGKLPENVIFTPLLIPECQADHAFFCGEKMGRCLSAEFPVKKSRTMGRPLLQFAFPRRGNGHYERAAGAAI